MFVLHSTKMALVISQYQKISLNIYIFYIVIKYFFIITIEN